MTATVKPKPWGGKIFSYEITDAARQFANEVVRDITKERNRRSRTRRRRDTKWDMDNLTQSRGEIIDGVTYLGKGATRIAFGLTGRMTKANRPCALKVQKRQSMQMETEIENWFEADEKLSGLLAPILETGPERNWVAMPQATAINKQQHNWDKIQFELQNELRKRDIFPDDVTEDNVGIIEGRAVLVDYGTLQI